MAHKKINTIGLYYGVSPEELISTWYDTEGLSGEAIAKKIHNETKISITSRAIHNFLKKLGISRDKSSARKIAITAGRIDYDHLRKPLKARELRKGISPGLRYAVMKRDSWRCVLCGRTAIEMRLVIDHIVAVVNNGSHNLENLRTLCFECNHGKMIYENEK